MPALKAMKMVHDVDPAEEIRKKVGSLEGFEIYSNQILVGVYLRPERTASGIYMPQVSRDEDRYQGKAGVVLKKGPHAFVNDDQVDFKGQNVEVGDWVACWVTDGRQIIINDHLCRIVKDTDIKLKIPAPDVVY